MFLKLSTCSVNASSLPAHIVAMPLAESSTCAISARGHASAVAMHHAAPHPAPPRAPRTPHPVPARAGCMPRTSMVASGSGSPSPVLFVSPPKTAREPETSRTKRRETQQRSLEAEVGAGREARRPWAAGSRDGAVCRGARTSDAGRGVAHPVLGRQHRHLPRALRLSHAVRSGALHEEGRHRSAQGTLCAACGGGVWRGGGAWRAARRPARRPRSRHLISGTHSAP